MYEESELKLPTFYKMHGPSTCFVMHAHQATLAE